jgi:hypothetical protein
VRVGDPDGVVPECLGELGLARDVVTGWLFRMPTSNFTFEPAIELRDGLFSAS